VLFRKQIKFNKSQNVVTDYCELSQGNNFTICTAQYSNKWASHTTFGMITATGVRHVTDVGVSSAESPADD